jgi:hypothetical protein
VPLVAVCVMLTLGDQVPQATAEASDHQDHVQVLHQTMMGGEERKLKTEGGCSCGEGHEKRLKAAWTFLYCQLFRTEELYQQLEDSMTEDVTFLVFGLTGFRGKAMVMQAIRTVAPGNTEVNTDIHDLEMFDACTTVAVRVYRGFRNDFTKEWRDVFYTYFVDFNKENQIEHIWDTPFTEPVQELHPFSSPWMDGGAEYMMCLRFADLCPNTIWPKGPDGEPVSCFQHIRSLPPRAANHSPFLDNPSKRCLGVLSTALTRQSAPMLCPMIAPGNGSPVGCF